MQTYDPTLVGKIVFVRAIAAPRAVKSYVIVGHDRGGLHVVSADAALDADTFEGGSYITGSSYHIIGVLSDNERLGDLFDTLEYMLNDPNVVWTSEVREGLTRKLNKLGVILANNVAQEEVEEEAQEEEARAAGEAAAEELEQQRQSRCESPETTETPEDWPVMAVISHTFPSREAAQAFIDQLTT